MGLQFHDIPELRKTLLYLNGVQINFVHWEYSIKMLVGDFFFLSKMNTFYLCLINLWVLFYCLKKGKLEASWWSDVDAGKRKGKMEMLWSCFIFASMWHWGQSFCSVNNCEVVMEAAYRGYAAVISLKEQSSSFLYFLSILSSLSLVLLQVMQPSRQSSGEELYWVY